MEMTSIPINEAPIAQTGMSRTSFSRLCPLSLVEGATLSQIRDVNVLTLNPWRGG